MLDKPFSDIKIEDLQQLVDDEISESVTLDYKSYLTKDKPEFLSDIVALTNKFGGLLIYGVREEKGVPVEIHGIEMDNPDKEIVCLENRIQSGIEPRIPVFIKPIKFCDKKWILLIKVAKGWDAPYGVKSDQHYKFFKRHSAGKIAMDLREIKTAMNSNYLLIDKANNYRAERIGLLNPVHNFNYPDGLPKLRYPQTLVFHAIPYEAFSDYKSLYIQKIINDKSVKPMFAKSWDSKINLKGILHYSAYHSGEYSSFVQINRNGIIEAVTCQFGSVDGNKKYLNPHKYENESLIYLEDVMKFFETFKINPPFVVYMSFINITGYQMPDLYGSGDGHEIADQAPILLEGRIIESFDIKTVEVLKPIFDQMWNACGLLKSENFDEEGNWVSFGT